MRPAMPGSARGRESLAKWSVFSVIVTGVIGKSLPVKLFYAVCEEKLFSLSSTVP